MSTKTKKKRAKNRTPLSSSSSSVLSGVDEQGKVEKSVEEAPEDVASLEDNSNSLTKQPEDPTYAASGEVTVPSSATVPSSVPEEFKGRPGGKKSKKRKAKKVSDMKPLSAQACNSSVSKEEKSFTFEEQLGWCIDQLELGLLRHNVTRAQRESNEKNIRTLRSSKVPIPKKRQLMRSLFGDYRSKMLTTPFSGGSGTSAKQPHMNLVERETAQDCGKFYKHSHSKARLLLKGTEESCTEQQQLFRFNFEVDS